MPLKATSHRTPTRPAEPSLEELATQTVTLGESFAQCCEWSNRIPKGIAQWEFLKMIERLKAGAVIDDRDDRCIDAVGRELVATANALRPGFGDRARYYDTHDYSFVDDDLKSLRYRIERWQEFVTSRGKLRNRLKARALLESVQ